MKMRIKEKYKDEEKCVLWSSSVNFTRYYYGTRNQEEWEDRNMQQLHRIVFGDLKEIEL
jgi:hypothetical protein